MKAVEGISFYVASTQSRRRNEELNRSGSLGGTGVTQDLGYGVGMKLFKLSDGRVLLTNNLWNDMDGWVTFVPDGGLFGYRQETRICQ